MEAKREKIVGLLHTEMPFLQIMKNNGKSLSTIYRDKNSSKEQERIKHKPGLGRKPSVVIPRIFSAIKSRIDRNPIRSMRRMAKDLNVSEATVRRVLKKNLSIRPLARIK